MLKLTYFLISFALGRWRWELSTKGVDSCIWYACAVGKHGLWWIGWDACAGSWPCKASLARSSSCSLSPSCTRSSVAESRLAEQPSWVSSRSLLNMSFICLSRWTSSWSWATSSRNNTEVQRERETEIGEFRIHRRAMRNLRAQGWGRIQNQKRKRKKQEENGRKRPKIDLKE